MSATASMDGEDPAGSALSGRSQRAPGQRARKGSTGACDPDGPAQRGTTRLSGESLLRVSLPRGIAGNRQECEVMIDQSRAIDNGRFVRALRGLPRTLLREVEDKLRRLGDL